MSQKIFQMSKKIVQISQKKSSKEQKNSSNEQKNRPTQGLSWSCSRPVAREGGCIQTNKRRIQLYKI